MSRFSPARRLHAVALAALVAAASLAPVAADARAGRGLSFGSRGSKTFSAPPSTSTMPGGAPIQRSITQPGQPGQPGANLGAPGAAAQPARRGGLFGGLGGGLLGGFLGAGLFGMLFGGGLFGGLGSLSSIFGLLIQIGLVVIVVRLVMGWLARRKGESPVAAGAGPSNYRFDGATGSGESGRSFGSSFGSGAGAAAVAPVSLEKPDFDAFERILGEVQDAWSAQDLPRMRGLATPEMVEVFGEDVAEQASRGVVNHVSDVKLEQGDLAEAWREDAREYATVAMRYSLIDVTTDRDSGRVVEGDADARVEAAELWTFVRAAGGRWLLSAIQQRG